MSVKLLQGRLAARAVRWLRSCVSSSKWKVSNYAISRPVLLPSELHNLGQNVSRNQSCQSRNAHLLSKPCDKGREARVCVLFLKADVPFFFSQVLSWREAVSASSLCFCFVFWLVGFVFFVWFRLFVGLFCFVFSPLAAGECVCLCWSLFGEVTVVLQI